MNSDFKVDSPIPIPTPTTPIVTLKTESTSTKLKTEDLSSPAQNPIKKNDATNMSTSVITLVDDDKQKIKSLEGREYICTNKVLGHGNFSRVYGGYACQYTPVAIKKIAIADANSDKNKKYLQSEISIMTKLKHENIVNLLDVIWQESDLYLVLERCGGGDFKKYLDNKAMKEEYAQFYMKQLAEGLKYLCMNNVTHRDLKPQNMLLTEDNKILKISDFGFAKILGSNALQETMCGSPMYMAPEIMNHEPYTDKSDLWSVGVIIYEVLFARYHIKGVSGLFELMKALKSFKVVEFPKKPVVSQEAKDLMFALLEKNHADRISWDEFFKHSWFYMKFGKKSESVTTTTNIAQSISSSAKQKQVKQPLIAPLIPTVSKHFNLGKSSNDDYGADNSLTFTTGDDTLFKFDEDKSNRSLPQAITQSSTSKSQKINIMNYSPNDRPGPPQHSPSNANVNVNIPRSQQKKIEIPQQPVKTVKSQQKPIVSHSVPSSMPSNIPQKNVSGRINHNSNNANPFQSNSPTSHLGESPQNEVSLHMNGTSPFVKSGINPISLNIVDDYSSTDVFPGEKDGKFNNYSAPSFGNSRYEDNMIDRNAISLMSIKGKKMSEPKDEEEKLTKTVKDYAFASLSLLKDSFKSFNGLN